MTLGLAFGKETNYSGNINIATPFAGIYNVTNDNQDALLPCHVAGEVNGEWTCPTIYLEGDVTIPAGDTLRIDKAVKKVFALGPYRIKVKGVLLAIEPENDRVDLFGDCIIFGGRNWHGIFFNNLNGLCVGTSVIENCSFDYGDKMDIPYQGGGAMVIDGCSPTLSNVLFEQNISRGLVGAVAITSDTSHQVAAINKSRSASGLPTSCN